MVSGKMPASSRRRAGLGVLAIGLGAALTASGCGNQYRPVVSAINPVGPAGAETKYAIAISNPGTGLAGLLTFVDVSGDTILSTPSIQVLPAPASLSAPINPNLFALGSSGAEGFVINPTGAFDQFATSNPTGLRTENIVQTTLAANSAPVSVQAIQLGGAGLVFVPEAGSANVAPSIAVLSTASGPSLLQDIAVGANPVYVVGADGTQRVYAISQLTAGGAGQIAAIEAATFSISSTIPVGITPVYGVMTTDTKRAFILNKGSGTVSVINVVNNAPDVTLPTITLPGTGTAAPNPVWADLSPLTSELVVLNAGNGTSNGSLSIISIPLCNATAQVSNPNCDVNNPVDAAGFGTIVATVPVGLNPSMVSVLNDGTRAYVVNQGDATHEGSVSVVNLISGTVTATIQGISTAAGTLTDSSSPTLVYGHPNTIAATTGTPSGKVYITSSDNKYMTVLRTDTDAVQTHVSLQGLGLRVRVTAP